MYTRRIDWIAYTSQMYYKSFFYRFYRCGPRTMCSGSVWRSTRPMTFHPFISKVFFFFMFSTISCATKIMQYIICTTFVLVLILIFSFYLYSCKYFIFWDSKIKKKRYLMERSIIQCWFYYKKKVKMNELNMSYCICRIDQRNFVYIYLNLLRDEKT